MVYSKLPQGWVECELKDIFDTSSGGTPKRGNPAYYGGNIPWLKSGELNNGIVTEAEEYITEEGLKNSSAKLFPRGSLLIALYGATVGKLGILDFDSTTNQAICCIYQNKYYDRDFLFYYLLFKKEYLVNQGKGGAQPNISQEIIKALKIPVPPLNEQKRIVEKIEEEFGKIDEGVEKLKLAQEQIKQFRQSVLKSAFDGKLYKTTKWEEVYFKDIVHSYKNGLSKRNGNGNVSTVVLRLADIDGFNISLQNLRRINLTEKEIENYSIDYNDMLIIRVNGSEDIVGKFILYNLEAQFIYCDHLIRLKYNQDLILPKFLFYYAQTPVVRDYIKKNKVSTAGQNTVNQTVLNAMKIFLPTIKEQEQVIREIEKRFEVADDAERVITENLEKAEQLKQSILKKAFEGRLVSQDPTDEPASELLAKIKAERGT